MAINDVHTVNNESRNSCMIYSSDTCTYNHSNGDAPNHCPPNDLLLDRIPTAHLIDAFLSHKKFQEMDPSLLQREILPVDCPSDPRWSLLAILQYGYVWGPFTLSFLSILLYYIWNKILVTVGRPVETIILLLIQQGMSLRMTTYLRTDYKKRKKKVGYAGRCSKFFPWTTASKASSSSSIPFGFDFFDLFTSKQRRTMNLVVTNTRTLNRSDDLAPKLNHRRTRTLIRRKGWASATVSANKSKEPQGFRLCHQEGLPGVMGEVCGQDGFFLLDTGCRFNIITSKRLLELESKEAPFIRFPNKTNLVAHNDTPLCIRSEGVYLPLKVRDLNGVTVTVDLPFLVEESKVNRFSILGYGAIKDRRIIMDAGKGTVHFDFQQLGWDFPPSTDQMFSIVPQKNGWLKGPVDLFIPALKDFDGYVNVSPLDDTCCNMLHAPEVSCTWASKSLAQQDFQVDPLPHDAEGDKPDIQLNQTLYVRHGRFEMESRGQNYFSQYRPIGKATIATAREPESITTWPVLPDSEKWFTTCDIQAKVHQTLLQERHDVLDTLQSAEEGCRRREGYRIQVRHLHGPADLRIEIRPRDIADTAQGIKVLGRERGSPTPGGKTRGTNTPEGCQGHTPSNFVWYVETDNPDSHSNKALLDRVRSFVSRRDSKSIHFGDNLPKTKERCLQMIKSIITKHKTTVWMNILSPMGKSEGVHVIVDRPDPKPPPKEVVKHGSLMEDMIGIPPRILDPTGLEFLSEAVNPRTDLSSLMETSDPTMKGFLENIFQAFPQAVSNGPTDIGCITAPEFCFDLDLKSESEQLPRHKPHPTSLPMKKACDRIIRLWIDAGIAQRSTITSHASRLVIVKKHVSPQDLDIIKERLLVDHDILLDVKDPQAVYRIDPDLLLDKEISKIYRVTLDAVDLNAICKPETQVQQSTEVALHDLCLTLGDQTFRFPPDQSFVKDNVPTPVGNTPPIEEFMRNLEEQIQNMGNEDDDVLFVSSCDIRSAHNILSLSERAKYLLTFISPSMEIFQFLRGCFGLQSINSRFNQVIIKILSDLILLNCVFVYSDDLLIIVRGRRNHCKVLLEVLRRFHNQHIKLSLNKCSFFVRSFTYLGFRFDEQGAHLTDERIRALTSFAVPRNVKGLQKFLRCLVYLRKFYPKLCFDILPLTEAIKHANKTQDFIWGKEQQDAFERAKHVVGNGLKLNYVPASKQLNLYVDSSKHAGGGVLFASNIEDTDYRPVAFYSRKYSDNESRLYNALELESINLLYCLEKLQYFIDSNCNIDIHTDAKALVWLIYSAKRSSNSKLARLCAKLSAYPVRYKLIYTAPTHEGMIFADSLSRQHDAEKDEAKALPISHFRAIQKSDITVDFQDPMTFRELVDHVDNEQGISVQCPTDMGGPAMEGSTSFRYHRNVPTPPLPQGLAERAHNNLVVSSKISHGNIILEQERHLPTKAIRDQLIHDSNSLPEIESRIVQGHCMRKGLLLKLVKVDLGITEDNTRVVIPPDLTQTLIASYHVCFGHLGRDNLVKILTRKYSAAGMTPTVFPK